MSPATHHRQTPRTEAEDSQPTKENGTGEVEEEAPAVGPLETVVDEMVESRTTELREELEALEQQVEALDNFARISLNERKVKQNEAKLSEFSESLTAFAEKAFNNINALEDRLDTQALVLAAVVEALDGEVDLSEAQRYREDRLVADRTPDERLADAVADD